MRIVRYGRKVKTPFSKYKQTPEQSSKETLNEARTSLSDSYNALFDEGISAEIDLIDRVQKNDSYKFSWKLVKRDTRIESDKRRSDRRLYQRTKSRQSVLNKAIKLHVHF